ncbi:MAG TPA: hypothetical protein VGJ20_45780 [Xanthobacteraceae bacterium]|jgi:hypothetical protein
MTRQIIEYRGYELHVVPQGTGLKVLICVPGATFARPEVAQSADKNRRQEIIAEARAMVDAILQPPPKN